jgi:hypothetical protein
MSVIIVSSLCEGLCQTPGGIVGMKQLVMDALARSNRIDGFELTVPVRVSSLKADLRVELRQRFAVHDRAR